MTTASDDEQPTAAVGDDTAVADSSRTVAAGPRPESSTTIIPSVGGTQAAELAWSSEAETEEIADQSHRWGGQLLWMGLVALLCAAVAVVVWFSLTLYREQRPVTATPTVPPRSAVPPASPALPPAAPIAPPAAASPPASPVPPAAPLPPPPAAQSNITQQQANTICGWLRDPSWTMPQIESSTGDMLADGNPNFRGTPDVLKAIAAALSGTCPDASNQRPF